MRGEQDLPRWEVDLVGDESDLNHLVKHFTNGPCHIWRDETTGQVLMRVDGFPPNAEARQVQEAASVTVRQLSGVLKVIRGSKTPLQTGGVMQRQANGTRNVFLFAESLAMATCFMEAAVFVRDANGNLVERPSPPPRTLVLAKLMLTDAALAKAMRLRDANDAGTWVGLYRLYEVIKHDVGSERAMVSRGWTSKAQQDRYRHTSNSPDAAGDDARHGATNDEPPANPMTLEEARTFVEGILQAWLDKKLSAAN